MDVADWLRAFGLGQYEQAFHENDVDAEVLVNLTVDDLIGLGVTSIGHRRKLLAAIASLPDARAPLSQPIDGVSECIVPTNLSTPGRRKTSPHGDVC